MNFGDELSPARVQAAPQTRVLAAAGEVFLNEGFAGATVDQVAALARMSKLSIYELYPTKSALFEAAVKRASSAQFLPMPAEVRGNSLEESLHLLGSAVFDRFLDPINFGLFRANIEAADHFPELATELHEHRRQVSEQSANVLRPWLAEGADALEVAIAFSATCVQGARYFLGAQLPGTAERTRLVDDAVALFLNGYAPARDGEPIALIEPSVPETSGGVTARIRPDRLEAALRSVREEFLEHGFKSASIERAAAAVGVGKATLYRHFGSKMGVFRYLIEQHIHREGQFDYPVAPTGNLLDDVQLLARHARNSHCNWENIRTHRMLIQEAAKVADLARKFYDVRVSRLGAALARVLRAHGRPAPDAGSTRAFYNLATAALRYLTASYRPDPRNPDDGIEGLARMFIEGIPSR